MSMGKALRMIQGGGAVEVVTRLRDLNIQTMRHPETGQEMTVPADTLFAFSALRFREIEEGSDIWEFRLMTPTASGTPVAKNVYVAGTDIFVVTQTSNVIGS
jgi:hypothetical protein